MEDKDYLKDTEKNREKDSVEETEELTELQPGDSADSQKTESEEEKDYERFCFLCRRPESKTGKLITLAQGMAICPECRQKTVDTIQNGNIDF